METHATLVYAPNIATAPISEELKTQAADVRHFIGTQCGVAAVAHISAAAMRRPVSGVQTLILCYQSLTTEAQNALLKLIEEPPPQTTVYLIVPEGTALLSTLRSRVLDVRRSEQPERSESVDVFLASPVGKRMAHIAALHKAEDREQLTSLLTGLLRYIAENPTAFSALIRTRARECASMAGTRGIPIKRTVEHLALALPVASSVPQ